MSFHESGGASQASTGRLMRGQCMVKFHLIYKQRVPHTLQWGRGEGRGFNE